MATKTGFWVVICVLIFSKYAIAQKDSVLLADSSKAFLSIEKMNNNERIDTLALNKKGMDRNPVKAMLMSAVLPGLGQIYNRRYWKVPVIYGLFTGIYLLSDYNNKQYKKYLSDYVAISDNDPNTVVKYFPRLRKDDLLYWKDRYRRDRDLNYILLAGIWILNIFDASVDAHMMDFDVNENLSLRVEPFCKPAFSNQSAMGVSLKLRF